MVAGFMDAPTPSRRTRIIAEARQHLSSMQVAEAERALEPLLKKAKPDAEALLLMGVIHERRRRLAQAMECAKRSVALHEHPEPLLLLARCHRMVGETEDALQCCDRALAMRPGLLGALVI
jgi:tetratricopeptide (TPR) repeat protein